MSVEAQQSPIGKGSVNRVNRDVVRCKASLDGFRIGILREKTVVLPEFHKTDTGFRACLQHFLHRIGSKEAR